MLVLNKADLLGNTNKKQVGTCLSQLVHRDQQNMSFQTFILIGHIY